MQLKPESMGCQMCQTLTNAIFVYPPLIYTCKYDADLAKYLSDLYIYGPDIL